MIENVRGILDAVFDDYRNHVAAQLDKLGYWTDWRLFNAADFGVSQVRLRVLFVAIKRKLADAFFWPLPGFCRPKTVGECLFDLMAEHGWKGAKAWREKANSVAPTIVGGPHTHALRGKIKAFLIR